MKLSIENFGAIKDRIEIKPADLTIFCGLNNTGKTYALYVLNALLDARFVASFDVAKVIASSLHDSARADVEASALLDATAITSAQNAVSKSLKQTLSRFFVAQEVLTEHSQFKVTLDESAILSQLPTFNFDYAQASSGGGKPLSSLSCCVSDNGASIEFELSGQWGSRSQIENVVNLALMELYCPFRQGRVMLLPAERSGINLFFRELNSRRAALLRHVTSQTLDTQELLKDIIVSRYPQPIHDYIEFMNAQPEIKRQTSSEFADLATRLQKEVLKVKYKVDRYGDISIAPSRSGVELGLHLGSSTAKTFFGLWSYLNHLAKSGDVLMIDEPELNLHPTNQRAIARLLAELVNRGIRVVVSTHSDYMVREWGNLVMMSEDFSGRDQLQERLKISAAQQIASDRVAAYEFDSGGAHPMNVSGQDGIRTKLFDESIEEINAAMQEIYFARQGDSE
jgi:predicted ATP-binding protein involved in virulence